MDCTERNLPMPILRCLPWNGQTTFSPYSSLLFAWYVLAARPEPFFISTQIDQLPQIYFVDLFQIKMIIATTASLGRIDRPFLAKGRGRKLDKLPQVHTCDLLAHEAHRHPFVETLGLVYLMKFRYSESFCHRAGSAWRLIFVYALMPWLHKHRIRGIGQRDTTYQKEKNEPYMTVPSDGVSGNDGSAIDENSFRDRSGKGTRMCRI